MTDLRIAATQIDILGSGVPDRLVAFSELEVLGKPNQTDRNISFVELEILIPAQPVDFSGKTGSSVYDVEGSEEPVWHWDGSDLIPGTMIQSI